MIGVTAETRKERPKERPDCYACEHRRPLAGDAHSTCLAPAAHVAADRHGMAKGWFDWPFCFDPVWLHRCDSFAAKEEQ